MNGSLFKDFNFAAYDFHRFQWFEILNIYVHFLFTNLFLGMTATSFETLENEDDLNKIGLRQTLCIFNLYFCTFIC